MKTRHGKFYITCSKRIDKDGLHYSVKEKEGYVFEFSGINFGIDKRAMNDWVLTELSTGYSLDCQKTKKAILENFDVIFERLQKSNIMDRVQAVQSAVAKAREEYERGKLAETA